MVPIRRRDNDRFSIQQNDKSLCNAKLKNLKSLRLNKQQKCCNGCPKKRSIVPWKKSPKGICLEVLYSMLQCFNALVISHATNCVMSHKHTHKHVHTQTRTNTQSRTHTIMYTHMYPPSHTHTYILTSTHYTSLKALPLVRLCPSHFPILFYQG